MKYKVKIYPSAKRDLKDIVTYLSTLSPQAGHFQYEKLIARIMELSDMPNRCPLVKDMMLQLKGYRFLAVNNYIVFYVVVSDTVQIRRILHEKRDYLKVLNYG